MSFIKQFLFFLLILIVISFLDYKYLNTGVIGIDDGNIFLNYAHHISHGDGFVFNTNGEKVEGFTSLLWVLICSFFYLLTQQPEFLLICFSLLLTASTITIIYRIISKDFEIISPAFRSRYFFWIYTAFIISIGPSYVAWSVLSLMENALWNFLFAGIVLLVTSTTNAGKNSLQKQIAIIVSGCLLSITRPEALAWNLVFTCILIFTALQNKRRIYFPIIFLLFVAATEVALTSFRLHYFGFKFPNTYYAKISPDKIYNITEGLKYAMGFLTGYQPVITFLFVVMIASLVYGVFKINILKRHPENLPESVAAVIKRSLIISTIVLIGFFLPCTTGGDHFGGFRFYQGLLLLCAFGILLFVWLFNSYTNNRTQISAVMLSIVIFFFLILGLNDTIDLKNPSKTQLNFEFLLAREGRNLADKLNILMPANKPSIGIIAVGGFGLKYQGNTVDLMGLNNILMGHSPGDRKGIKNHAAFNKDVFYKLNPDIILPVSLSSYKQATIQYSNLLDPNNFDNQAMKNIFNDESFQNIYSPVYISSANDTTGVFAFANSNFINQNKISANFSIEEIKPLTDSTNLK